MDASPERTEGHPTDGVACGGARRVGAMSDHGEGEPVRNRSAGTALLLSLAAATVVVAGLVLVPVAVGSVDRSGAAAKPGARTEGADVTLADVRTYEVRLGHQDGTIDYPESPPVGGPHHPVWLDCGVYDVPVPEEHVVHDLEHGTTWLTYRPDLAEDQVAALAELLPSNGILSPYADTGRAGRRHGVGAPARPDRRRRPAAAALPPRARRGSHGPGALRVLRRRSASRPARRPGPARPARPARPAVDAACPGVAGRSGSIGGMDSEILTVRTGDRERVHDLTRECADFCAGRGDGLLQVFVPHATAGIAILETGAGSDDDLLAALGDLLPADDRWRHRHGSPGHGRSHVMPALVPPYATVPVLDGALALGTWQSICLVDLNVDNAERSVRLSFLAG